MNTGHVLIEMEVNGSCAKPRIRERLSVYVTDPLGDPLAEEVEDHLLDCRHCRELFLMMLRVRKELGKTNRVTSKERRSSEPPVLILTDFRKHRH